VFYRALRTVLAVLGKLVFRPKVEGLRNVPAQGAVILASNHLSFIDSVVIPVIVPRPVTFLSKDEYFLGRAPHKRFIAGFLTALGHVPVRRGQARAGVAALEMAGEVLAGGGAFAIYPEGTRSLDLRLYRGHTGVAQLALTSGAPVVPVALCGTQRLQPVGKKLPRLHRVTVRFGTPLDFSKYQGLGSSQAIRRSVTDEIMYAIMELSGQEYVDEYHKRPDAA
jgi:1-acyl-sn-glycerol-3-phosphate acyltransferase